MKNVRMSRFASHPEHGTYAPLSIDGQPMCVTLEPYNRDNESNISCIPAGPYICKRIKSPTYGWTFEITNVQGRTNVLFHWGNRDNNTEACILVGEEFGTLYGDWAILSSKKAFKEFMNVMKNETEFLLTITESY